MAIALKSHYPWTTTPLIVSAPMLRIAMAPLAVAVSAAGGLGFLASGYDQSSLSADLAEATDLCAKHSVALHDGLLPIGVGFLNWGSDLDLTLAAIQKYPPVAVWFFAPKQLSDLIPWAKEVRAVTGNRTKVWVQIGTVADAVELAKTTQPDVIVAQGSDGGGHGLQHRAGIISLLPEVCDALAKEGLEIPVIAAGGIVDGRGTAAALALGASGVVLGTRFLASQEATIAKGYQDEILRASDGGVSTVTTTIYDVVRGIRGWPAAYNGRGVANRSYQDALHGMSDEENYERYKETMKQGDKGWGPEGRMTTYAGTGIGLVRKVMPAAQIIKEISQDTVAVLERSVKRYSK